MFSFPKEKKRKDLPKLHDLAFLLILWTLLQPARFFYSCRARICPFLHLPSKLLCFFSNKIKIKRMQHYSKRSSFAEKVLFSKKKKKEERKNETWRPRPHIPSHIASAAACAFFLLLQREKREKLPFGPLLASPRFSLQLQDFAAVSMETAALRVQKAKSCSRVTGPYRPIIHEELKSRSRRPRLLNRVNYGR